MAEKSYTGKDGAVYRFRTLGRSVQTRVARAAGIGKDSGTGIESMLSGELLFRAALTHVVGLKNADGAAIEFRTVQEPGLGAIASVEVYDATPLEDVLAVIEAAVQKGAWGPTEAQLPN